MLEEVLAAKRQRNDDDFRLLVDQSLSRLFKATDFADLFARWFGRHDDCAVAFFRQSALPE